MDLKDQTCTAEQGARLVELGIKPVATFYHMPGKSEKHGPYIQYGWSSDVMAPAYNVAELGDMLPHTVRFNKTQKAYIDLKKYSVFYGIGYRRGCSNHLIANVDRKNEAEARAAIIIHLLENNLMELPPHWRQDPNDPCADGRCKLIYSKDMEVIKALPLPTDEDLKDPRFKAMWAIMKSWTIHAPENYKGYLEGVGGHVKLLLDAQKEVMNESNPIPGAIGSDH